VRDARTIALSSLVQYETEWYEPAVDPARFRPAEDAYPGHWLLKPAPDELPEEQLLADELSEQVRQALAALPPAQGEVVRLRDVEGFSSDEVCQLLDISEGNQRVLLHRGRSRIRGALEHYMTNRTW
jgi:RNA polymerase sigma-70 factor (ECF subfamily)